MTELEPTAPNVNTRNIIARFVVGAAPALIGVLLPISHIRRPLVGAEYRGLFVGGCVALVCISLAIALYYALERVARRICDRFDLRHDELMAEIVILKRRQQAVRKEIAHLRKLVILQDDGTLAGPSPYS